MAGGMDPGRGRQRRTLAERAASSTGGPGPDPGHPDDGAAVRRGVGDAAADIGTDDGADGRPCWVSVSAGPIPGVVHAWRRDATTGGWEALVVAWLPADSVRPRPDCSV